VSIDSPGSATLPTSRKDLRTTLKRSRVAAVERVTRNKKIAERLLQSSSTILTPNFSDVTREDVQRLFNSYDELYFDDMLKRTLGDTPLKFRVSSRMTRAGGKTGSWRKNRNAPIERFEIVISSTLLLQTFNDDQTDRPIHVTGLECHNRLDALMRVMEHELIHLSELLGWDSSSCTQDRFQTFAWQTFGHTDHQHELITPREYAASRGIGSGAWVRFVSEGKSLEGIVNRVTRRATVLVPDASGERFSDGNTYRKYYVPISILVPIDGVS
jgi:hypothetical protein